MRLNEGGPLSAMFDEVERQLREQGIQVLPTYGALVEARIMRA